MLTCTLLHLLSTFSASLLPIAVSNWTPRLRLRGCMLSIQASPSNIQVKHFTSIFTEYPKRNPENYSVEAV